MKSNPGDTLCKGGSVRLFASGAYAYTWWPSSGLNSTTSATPLATPDNSTIYRVIGRDDRGCFQDTGYVNVKVYPIPTVNAGLDQTINVGQTIELKPVISGDVSTVLWIPTNSIIASNYPAVLVKPNVTTEYTVEVRNPGGCKSKDKVTVFVVCNGANVFIPNTFSPNGDGVNDIFYPRGTGLFSIKSFRIFNRWGQLVYEKGGFMPNDASAGWNGTYNGQRLNPDVYVYMVDIVCDNSNVLTFKGDVALIQ
jgi:gliding motility-associated-like protein